MKISIFGAGYVGLVTGACFADKGHQVDCVDYDESKVKSINAGRSPIFEVGLDDILARTIGKTLRATTDAKAAVLASDMTMIAVGTRIMETLSRK